MTLTARTLSSLALSAALAVPALLPASVAFASGDARFDNPSETNYCRYVTRYDKYGHAYQVKVCDGY